MWISNVPSSVLCVSIALPIVHQLPNGDPFAKALLLGIAFSNNIGGMTTPIASPQNVIAFGWCEQASQTTFSLFPSALLAYSCCEEYSASHPPFLRNFPEFVLSPHFGQFGQQVGAGVTFISWMFFSLPFCTALLLVTWNILRYRYPPRKLP
jgi:di/tricarboxylate transporter